jgi:hypothetical protein
MNTNSEWVQIAGLVVLTLTLGVVFWYTWETRLIRQLKRPALLISIDDASKEIMTSP